jgi:hypothetical protein
MHGSFRLGSAVLVALTGCTVVDPEGAWQSREPLSNGQLNQLILSSAGDSSMTLYALPPGNAALAKLSFGVAWDFDGDELAARASCREGCLPGVQLDFAFRCTLFVGQQLDCTAERPFSGYGFLEFEPATQ